MMEPFFGTPDFPGLETYLNKGSQLNLSYARGTS